MRRVVLAAVIWAASPAAASPRAGGGIDYTAARGSRLEQLDLGWRLEVGPFVQVGPWHATASFIGLLNVRSDLPARDGDRLVGLALGARVAYRVPVDGRGVAFVGLGIERLWLEGHDLVVRGCRQTGACLVGYYSEKPDYDAWVPQLRVGVGPYVDAPALILGATFELIVQPIAFADIPPDGVRGIAVFGGITATIGGAQAVRR